MRAPLKPALAAAGLLIALGGCRVDRVLKSPGDGSEPPNQPPPPLAPFDPIGLGQFRADGTPIHQGETITQPDIVISAVVNDPESGDSVQLQLELRLAGTAFTGAPTHFSERVALGRRAEIAVNGINLDTSFHWRVRAVDRVGRASSWVSFGSADADFRVSLPRLPRTPVDLQQLRNEDGPVIPVGGTVSDREVFLQARVDDPSRTGELTLEIEIRPLSQDFTGQSTHRKDRVRHGDTERVKFNASSFVTYHWQARLCDREVCSAWVSFGGNPESAGDFTRNPFEDDDDASGVTAGTAGPLD